ncbi:hypothetical protein K437DRAFT_206911, partial [Tilletiaria anomala UBC 951]
RCWAAAFAQKNLTQEQNQQEMHISFTRSSGPGGQHVNKTSSKAVVRLDLKNIVAAAADQDAAAAMDKVVNSQRWLLPTICKRLASVSPYYVANTHSLQLSSSKSRSAHANLADALSKLHAHIHQVASSDLPGETSDEQRAHVRRLEDREKRKIKAVKEKRKDLKKGR